MTYIDCYLAPVPRENRATYEDLAKISAQIVKEHGALRVIECWLDESGSDASSYHGSEARLEAKEYGSFVRAANAGMDETVVMSFIECPDKATRDAGMEKVTSDPRMQFQDQSPAFDVSDSLQQDSSLCWMSHVSPNNKKFLTHLKEALWLMIQRL